MKIVNAEASAPTEAARPHTVYLHEPKKLLGKRFGFNFFLPLLRWLIYGLWGVPP